MSDEEFQVYQNAKQKLKPIDRWGLEQTTFPDREIIYNSTIGYLDESHIIGVYEKPLEKEYKHVGIYNRDLLIRLLQSIKGEEDYIKFQSNDGLLLISECDTDGKVSNTGFSYHIAPRIEQSEDGP